MNDMKQAEAQDFSLSDANALYDRGFAAHLGFEFVEWVADRAVLELEIQDWHLNLAGVLHGGIIATLLDIAGAAAGSYCPYPGRIRKAITLSMTTTFTGQASAGVVRAIGRRRAGGRRIFNSTVDIVDADERLLAIGEGTYRLRRGCEGPEGVPIDA
ncbi:Phenylacetic acid degradation protein [Salinisphaera shabanensis E1L3A]|uniref:Phenylacetic acid degradation protein n=2 Tax=Salinisphaera shabanensis TaxID=180542 RepID=U2FTR3_9GAMM|nr:PaaI family thioesterase [Salinisphaera shabanensis]ERJ19364.1 Phenylacetic acid degradation protein [Salinisphaera shabanensis E1L3A]